MIKSCRYACAGFCAILATHVPAFAAAPLVEETIVGPWNVGGDFVVSQRGGRVAHVGGELVSGQHPFYREVWLTASSDRSRRRLVSGISPDAAVDGNCLKSNKLRGSKAADRFS